jgi:hypothetical protein
LASSKWSFMPESYLVVHKRNLVIEGTVVKTTEFSIPCLFHALCSYVCLHWFLTNTVLLPMQTFPSCWVNVRGPWKECLLSQVYISSRKLILCPWTRSFFCCINQFPICDSLCVPHKRSFSCMILICLDNWVNSPACTLDPWRWRHQIPPKLLVSMSRLLQLISVHKHSFDFCCFCGFAELFMRGRRNDFLTQSSF